MILVAAIASAKAGITSSSAQIASPDVVAIASHKIWPSTARSCRALCFWRFLKASSSGRCPSRACAVAPAAICQNVSGGCAHWYFFGISPAKLAGQKFASAVKPSPQTRAAAPQANNAVYNNFRLTFLSQKHSC